MNPNAISSTTRIIKQLVLLGTLLLGIPLVSGCSNILHRLGYMPIPQHTPQQHTSQLLSKACASTPVLITNLEQATNQQVYQLPDGRLFLEEPNDETLQ